MRGLFAFFRTPAGATWLMIGVVVAFVMNEFSLLTGEPEWFNEWEPDEFVSLFIVFSLALPVLLLVSANRDLERARRLVVARQIAEELAAAGVRIALDDFGAGTSSLVLLTRLPLHTIKIDRSFISEVDHHLDRAKGVFAVLALAESLGLDVTAEGTERTEELDLLRKQHCPTGQGYLLGRAQPAEWVEAHLTESLPSPACHCAPLGDTGLETSPAAQVA